MHMQNYTLHKHQYYVIAMASVRIKFAQCGTFSRYNAKQHIAGILSKPVLAFLMYPVCAGALLYHLRFVCGIKKIVVTVPKTQTQFTHKQKHPNFLRSKQNVKCNFARSENQFKYVMCVARFPRKGVDIFHVLSKRCRGRDISSHRPSLTIICKCTIWLSRPHHHCFPTTKVDHFTSFHAKLTRQSRNLAMCVASALLLPLTHVTDEEHRECRS